MGSSCLSVSDLFLNFELRSFAIKHKEICGCEQENTIFTFFAAVFELNSIQKRGRFVAEFDSAWAYFCASLFILLREARSQWMIYESMAECVTMQVKKKWKFHFWIDPGVSCAVVLSSGVLFLLRLWRKHCARARAVSRDYLRSTIKILMQMRET